VVGAYVAAFLLWRTPQGMWRFSGFGEVRRLALACALAGLVSAVVIMGLGLVKIPRSVLALHPVFTIMGLALVRMAYRMLYEHLRDRIAGGAELKRALVLGAGEAARLLLAGLRAQGWVVQGLLDDDAAKQGARLAGVPVLGPLARLAEPGLLGEATHIVVAMPSATRAERRRAFDLAAATGLPVLTVPSADELRTGRARIERLRDIEPDDLLGREPVVLDEAVAAATLRGRVVLVTGAGGSIGSELCRQVARFGPARLVLLELSEFNLYAIEQELAEAHPGLALVALIGDVKDAAWMQATLARWRPAVVFHAAAYKHVPLMEGLNAAAALANNVLGSLCTAEAAALAGVERFVLVSTDKAVNPTNVMGASKRAAELAVTALAARHPGTRFMAVRFGNVLGSSGSVIPRFKEQIARGGPVTVTHPDIIRYFMTIPEAARLVLQAGAVGESGQVMVLDMGEPVRIVDLARDLIRLSGHTTDEIAIEFTGLRPGEKLFEELLADTEATLPTPVERLRVARIAAGDATVLDGWVAEARAVGADDAAARALLRRWVPEYRAANSP
jgi:FlaA1/EpsC-like NDP-sugar epimerase